MSKTRFMFKAESSEKFFTSKVRPMQDFIQIVDEDNNQIAYVHRTGCLTENLDEDKITTIAAKNSLSEQTAVLNSLKSTNALLGLNWKGLAVLNRTPGSTRESHHLQVYIVSSGDYTLKIKDADGDQYSIPLYGIDYIQPLTSGVSDGAVVISEDPVK